MCYCTVGLLSFSGALMLAWGSRQASKFLHRGMLFNILRLPMTFFDTTPLGRITNRFSKDVDVIDSVLSGKLSMWWRCMLLVVGTVVVISMSTPIFLAVILPLGVFYFIVQVFCSRDPSLTKELLYCNYLPQLPSPSLGWTSIAFQSFVFCVYDSSRHSFGPDPQLSQRFMFCVSASSNSAAF